MSKTDVANVGANRLALDAIKQREEWNKSSYNWPVAETFVFKEVDSIKIEADVYVPDHRHHQRATSGSDGETLKLCNKSKTASDKTPIMLFIHGGGWISGTRSDFSRPMFYEFLTNAFVVVTIDYRLLPEADFVTEQLADMVSAEAWIREELEGCLKGRGIDVQLDPEAVVVTGASAGSHLASLTPRVWKKKPSSLILIAGPTNLLDVRKLGRPLGGGVLSSLISHIPSDPSAELIKSAMFSTVQTSTAPVHGLEGFSKPRSLLGLSIFMKAIYPEFIARGLVDGKLPEKGSVPEDEIKSISAFHSNDLSDWPPTFQMIGDNDEVWDASQLTLFHDTLRQRNVPSGVLIVPEASHGFEALSRIGDHWHLRYIKTACEFAMRFVVVEDDEKD